jgi:hypothetical protein
MRESLKDKSGKGLREETQDVAPQLAPEALGTDPGLSEVITAWPDLAEVIKSGILAMVRAASTQS